MARSNVPNILGPGRGNGVVDAPATRRRVVAGRGALGLALAVLCVALAACGSSSSSSSSAAGKTGVVNTKPGGSLTVLLNSGYEGAWPTGLDPATNTNGAANQDLMNSIYGNLFELGPGGKITSDLASGYSFADGGKTLTIHIRPGVKFTDGTPLNATAVEYNFTRDIAFHLTRPAASSCWRCSTAPGCWPTPTTSPTTTATPSPRY
jgi:ABC-type transport system substrate-binding protein